MTKIKLVKYKKGIKEVSEEISMRKVLLRQYPCLNSLPRHLGCL